MLALPREAAQISRINHFAQGLGERTPTDFQGVFAFFPKPTRPPWLRRVVAILALAAVIAGTSSPADAAVFIRDGNLYFLGPNGSGFMFPNTILVVVLVLAALVSAQAYAKWQRDEQYRREEAEAWEAARYYAARADEARELAQRLDADTARIERDIRAAYERFEDDEREETRKHEAKKRALMARGDRS